jgi:hypothetical protein
MPGGLDGIDAARGGWGFTVLAAPGTTPGPDGRPPAHDPRPLAWIR